MGKFVGVTDASILASSPNREAVLMRGALLFDQIALNSLRTGTENDRFIDEIEWLADRLEDDSFIKEIEWLTEKGVLFWPSTEWIGRLKNRYEYQAYRAILEETKQQLEEQIKNINHLLKYPELIEGDEEINRLDHLVEKYLSLEKNIEETAISRGIKGSRYLSLQLRQLNQLDAYPFFSLPSPLADPFVSGKSDIVRVVLNALPIPDSSTPWEHLLEFRSDRDVRGKFLGLRNWMSEIAKGQLNPNEIEDKLEYLLYEYQKSMELHKLKIQVGVLETILTTGAESLENVLRFKFGKASKILFSLKHRRIALMEAEMKSPGKEVAFIFKARQRFQQENDVKRLRR